MAGAEVSSHRSHAWGSSPSGLGILHYDPKTIYEMDSSFAKLVRRFVSPEVRDRWLEAKKAGNIDETDKYYRSRFRRWL